MSHTHFGRPTEPSKLLDNRHTPAVQTVNISSDRIWWLWLLQYVTQLTVSQSNESKALFSMSSFVMVNNCTKIIEEICNHTFVVLLSNLYIPIYKKITLRNVFSLYSSVCSSLFSVAQEASNLWLFSQCCESFSFCSLQAQTNMIIPPIIYYYNIERCRAYGAVFAGAETYGGRISYFSSWKYFFLIQMVATRLSNFVWELSSCCLRDCIWKDKKTFWHDIKGNKSHYRAFFWMSLM